MNKSRFYYSCMPCRLHKLCYFVENWVIDNMICNIVFNKEYIVLVASQFVEYLCELYTTILCISFSYAICKLTYFAMQEKRVGFVDVPL